MPERSGFVSLRGLAFGAVRRYRHGQTWQFSPSPARSNLRPRCRLRPSCGTSDAVVRLVIPSLPCIGRHQRKAPETLTGGLWQGRLDADRNTFSPTSPVKTSGACFCRVGCQTDTLMVLSRLAASTTNYGVASRAAQIDPEEPVRFSGPPSAVQRLQTLSSSSDKSPNFYMLLAYAYCCTRVFVGNNVIDSGINCECIRWGSSEE